MCTISKLDLNLFKMHGDTTVLLLFALEQEVAALDPMYLDTPGSMREIRQELLGDVLGVSQAACYVLVADGEVVGVCRVRYQGKKVGWVSNLGVQPGARGKGYAHILLGAGVQALKSQGATTVMLTVLAGNVAAQALYAKNNFRLHTETKSLQV